MSIFAILHLHFHHQMLHLFANTALALNTAYIHPYTLTLEPHCAIHYTTALPTHNTLHTAHSHTHNLFCVTLHIYIRAPNTYIHTIILILILILIYVHPHADIPHIQYHSITTTHTLADRIISICLE